MSGSLRSSSGQATVEYVGALLLVSIVFGGMLALTGLLRPATALAEAIAERLICAVRLSNGCEVRGSDLQLAYGPEIAALIVAHAPEIRFEDADFVSLPVDPRDCRERRCADSSEPGPLSRSFEDHPAHAFLRVIDCRPGQRDGSADCTGERAGNLYLQYWYYYPESWTRPFGRAGGFHRDDWESFQVRIDPAGRSLARASSHHGYNHGPDPLNDLRGTREAWGEPSGYLWVAAGSHAGRVSGAPPPGPSVVPADRLHLLPLESELDSLAALDFAVTPPWLKAVWRDPESTGT